MFFFFRQNYNPLHVSKVHCVPSVKQDKKYVLVTKTKISQRLDACILPGFSTKFPRHFLTCGQW